MPWRIEVRGRIVTTRPFRSAFPDEHPETLAELKDELLRWSGRLDAFEHPDEPNAKRNPHNWWDHPDWDPSK